ncbi:MAG TPA: hypothetical protein QGF58_11065 [Myxococcota bacterium]|nr:hypothetical protein [Myxococcota bacterium]
MSARALRALRLNLFFPSWRDIARHQEAIAIRPPHTRLRLCPDSGWPHADEWLRVRVDHDLADDLLQRMAHLGEAVAEKARYLRAIREIEPLVVPPPHAALVDPGPPARWEFVIDRVELALPSFVRWTLRLDLDGDPPELIQLRDLLGERPVAEAWRLLRELEELELVELVRGEIGPVLHEGSGPWISAVLSRASRGRGPVRVDDPIAVDVPVPTASHGFSMSRQRKWSTPRDDVRDLKRWLAARSSRNVVYSYSGWSS